MSMDSNTMNLKRLDVARILIKTSSWEVVNRVIKVHINALSYNIRHLEEPFPKYVFRQCPKKNDDVQYSSSSDSMSLGDFSLEGETGASIESEEEYDIQKLFVVEGVDVLNGDDQLHDGNDDGGVERCDGNGGSLTSQ